MRRLAFLAVLSLLIAGAPHAATAKTACDRAALRTAMERAHPSYESTGPRDSMTSVEMPQGTASLGARTRAAIRAGDIDLACGNPARALQEYTFASQNTARYDPADARTVSAKVDRAARLVLRDPNASAFDKRAARANLCLSRAMTTEAVRRCTQGA
jgi:hypothetical protein